ncbi:MAG: sugar ABC transporter ATP-binding protein [Clostridiales bacterium]|nr:sugar ABC transporter ATP-binding protein [Clostridiales bacterium]
MESDYVLQMDGVSKEYSGNRVLKNVSLSVKRGEIHALMGENGAGKSTLMNILFGMPVIHNTGGFEGSILLDGCPATISNPQEAMQAGIGMVHQEFMLIPGFTVTENIKVGRELTKPTFFSRIFGKSLETLDFGTMKQDARRALDTVGLGIEEHVRIAGLPVGYMQFIEIAREIDKTGIRLLVFDEPTAVLTESEAARLLAAMRDIAAQGIAIIFITHRLDEVMTVSDSVTILRDGELVTRMPTADTNVHQIAELMVGRKIGGQLTAAEERRQTREGIALKLRDLCVDMPGEALEGVDLDIREGEIFGVGGLAGQGKLGIPNGIMGLYPATGSVELFGEALDFDKLGDALQKGVAFVSEDRRGVGLLLEDSVRLNIIFTAMQINNQFLKGNMLDTREANHHAQEMVKNLDIRCTSIHQVVGDLSGGNQQKVCVARALATNPRLLFVSEPTRGIDIGAKRLVLDLLRRINEEQGMTIVMVSSELVELRSICDRIAIVSDGQVSAIMSPTDSDVNFGLAMSGIRVGAGGPAEELGGEQA